MALLLKKLRVPIVHDDGGDYSYEYSFAEEYEGPPLSYSVPEALPFNLHQVPLAHVAPSPPHHLSLPVIQPFRRKTNVDSALTTSSDSLSCREEDHDENRLSPKHVKQPSVVTFPDHDEEFVEYVGGESNSNSNINSKSKSDRVRPHAVRDGKKGSCYRCLKGNHFTEREVCIVCSAKYCCNCVVRAMGSMPEGRKCVTCIGYRIDENKRGKLGKPSRMLKNLLSRWEVKQIMKDEMLCEINQIPAEYVRVNGEPLDWDQLVLLLTCSNPPKGLKPGFYWYDKSSGFWGKEGQRPSQIISPALEIGGDLQRNASHGMTNVTINGREITKEELRLLKWARVPCEGTTDFWVSHDGSYSEVGQRNVKGRIWEKSTVKLVSLFLSLPVPSSSLTPAGEGENGTGQHNLQKKTHHKFLLVGSVKSGTCTIFKQAKLLYNVPFSENERQNIKLVIQSNLFRYLGVLLEAREYFEESWCQKSKGRHVDESTSSGISGEIIDRTPYSIGPRLKIFSEWLLKYTVSGNLEAIFPAAAREYAPLVEELWRDAAIRATYSRRNEIKNLPTNANYFLERAVEISSIDYEPLDMDILYSEGITLSNSLSSMEFSFTVSGHEDSLDPAYQHDPSLSYQLIRINSKSLGVNCKWLDMFDDTDVVLFSVALTDYDEYTVDSNGVATNKILAAKHLFENIITHRVFRNKNFLLLLTKFDLLEEKIERMPLTQCEWFNDFHPVISHNQKTVKISKYSNHPPLAQRAFQYIGLKFKRLFHSLTNRKLFVSLVTGLEPSTVDEALRYAREVMVWEKWDTSLRNEKSEITSTTFEASSDEKYNNYYPS
ncbi:extra-large guanine nucleotide-binding protein 1 [Cajanus cajan]|uniref:Guanine nucleotide-binding protein alpha-2 subunit n=1 Tax=Cajanus cajan TaxID=3821 RepID=A0A151TG46_CAJCA|nr:extra-large guanine nucleotide-binding protein 1 [Cajanus cajan]KYP66020.1 Guanine nucleotide-binding protein alpha-2 subunit [Cajanus cajan]